MAAALPAIVTRIAQRTCGATSIRRVVRARLVGAHVALVDLAFKVACAPEQRREVRDHFVLAPLLRTAQSTRGHARSTEHVRTHAVHGKTSACVQEHGRCCRSAM